MVGKGVKDGGDEIASVPVNCFMVKQARKNIKKFRETIRGWKRVGRRELFLELCKGGDEWY